MPPRRTQSRELTPAGSPIIATTTSINTPVELTTYYDRWDGENYLAVYHNDYRHVWIAQNPPSQYACQRDQGTHADDKTCYYQPHHNWGANRDNLPAIIFQYEPPRRSRQKHHPDYLYTSEGWLVLDYKHQPVLAYNMPLTLASNCEDFVLEAVIRENYASHIGVQDLMARMPGKMLDGREPHRVGTISMRMNRFRQKACCITWGPKVGSDAKKAYMDALLPEACKQANSTRAFRFLYPHEIAEMEMINVGHFPNKARVGKKDFSDENKDAKYAQAEKKYLKLKAEFDGIPPVSESHDVEMQDIDFFDTAQNSGHHPASSSSSAGGSSIQELRRRAALAAAPGSRATTSVVSSPHPSITTALKGASSAPATPEPSSYLTLPPTTTTSTLRTLHTLLLTPTVHHYRYLTRSPAPKTSDDCSYAQQLEHLQWALDNFLAENGIEIGGRVDGEFGEFGEFELVGLTVWTREDLVWNKGGWDEGKMGRMVDLRVVGRLMDGL